MVVFCVRIYDVNFEVSVMVAFCENLRRKFVEAVGDLWFLGQHSSLNPEFSRLVSDKRYGRILKMPEV